MKESQVSVIIPSFQQGEFLERTLQSVLSQRGVTLEVIVKDGGSTDGTVEILRRHKDRIRWTSGTDGGQAAAINAGLREASGGLVCYLNSDDVFLEGALAAVVKAAASSSSDFFYGRARKIGPDDEPLGDYPVEPWDAGRLLETCFISQPACFWRRRAHETIGYFDESLHFAMDYDFWLRAAGPGRFEFIDAPLAAARIHPGAKTMIRRADSFEEAFAVVRRHRPGYSSRRWILALAQARAERRLRASAWDPRGWIRFASAYFEEAGRLKGEFPISGALRPVPGLVPHAISAWKKHYGGGT
jgi:glycosyltransferase involved in cell wall biosynthesis